MQKKYSKTMKKSSPKPEAKAVKKNKDSEDTVKHIGDGRYVGDGSEFSMSKFKIPCGKPPHERERENNAIIMDLKDRVERLESEKDAITMAYEEELKREPVPVNLTRGKVICGMVVRRIEDSAWGHKASSVIGEGLVRELKEYAES